MAASELRQRKGKGSKATKAGKGKEKAEEKPTGSLYDRFMSYLWAQEDSSYLAFFRILWGLVMTFEIYRFLERDMRKTIYSFYMNPYGWNCKYWLFEWVGPLADIGQMRTLFYFLFFCGCCITSGFLYHPAALIYFFGISYIFLCESSSYLNHIYLTICMSLVMVFLPCNCAFSLDAWRKPERYRSDTVPKICLLFLQALLVIVYAFAGVVKMNEDWLRAEPLRHWIGRKNVWPFGSLLQYEATCYVFSYGGMIYDLLVGPMLMWNKTFWLGIAMTMFFHISNKLLFNIGIFPYMMIASTTLFFTPEWPRKLAFSIANPSKRYVPVTPPVTLKNVKPTKLTKKQKIITLLVVLVLVFWIFFPLRHYAIPGHVAWNEAGHKYSWRMKLRDKDCTGDFLGFQPAAQQAFEVPAQFIFAQRQYPKLMNRPWMLIQAAHFLADLYSFEGERAEIYAFVDCQLNHRLPVQPYTDGTVNLAAEEMWAEPYHWVTEVIPLAEEYQAYYPWNFEWNFNWLRGIHVYMPPIIEAERQARMVDKERSSERHREQFRTFIQDKYFEGKEGSVPPVGYVRPDPVLEIRKLRLTAHGDKVLQQMPIMPSSQARLEELLAESTK